MNIETTSINQNSTTQTQKTSGSSTDSSVKFSDELNNLKETSEASKPKTEESKVNNDKNLNQSDEKGNDSVKNTESSSDKQDMINKDYNVQEKDALTQMHPNMNFNSNGQLFSSFMNNSEQNQNQLSSSAKELAEEAAILSSMAENIAMANRNLVGGINTDLQGLSLRYDSVLMNQSDVEFFAQIVQNNDLNLASLTSENNLKSLQVSKTLADLLAKSMENNQPLRIDFDNNISVIIRISREGKISADFLPSSQIAEAYLKENLPLLKQKFEENNIEYGSLNQRERREQQKENNQKKGRNNE